MSSSEPRDLLRCLRWDAEGDERLAALGLEEWQPLLALTEESGMRHLLARRLHRGGCIAPPAIAAALRTHTRSVAARNLDARLQFAQAIRDTGRPAMLLKGVDLATRLYGNLGARPMGDVDFLVTAEDTLAYHDQLLRQGFTTDTPPDAALRASDEQHHAVYCHATDPRALPFELHWRLAHDRNDAHVDRDDLWGRAVPHDLAPGAVVMAPDDLFLYLCLHLKHHTFETSATQLWDVAELIASPDLTLDWDTVWRRAQKWHVTAAVRITLHLIHRTFGLPTQHLSAWTPDATLAACLPDPFATGGHFPSMAAQDRLATVLGAGNSWSDRGTALRRALLPSRAAVRAAHGRPAQSGWHDIVSYSRRYRYLIQAKRQSVFDWLRGRGQLRHEIDRLAALGRHLHGKD